MTTEGAGALEEPSGSRRAASPGRPRGPYEHRPAPRHTPPRHRPHLLRLLALGLTGVVAFVAAGAGAAYLDLSSDLRVDDVDPLLGSDRPVQRPVAVPTTAPDPTDPYAGDPINLLVMGTDLRSGTNVDVAGTGDGMRSDTTLLVHVSADRTRAEVVSIPRDSLVDIPSCTLGDGTTTSPRSSAMFNEAFTIGGGPDEDIGSAAACTRRTVEQLTGVRTTDHVVVQMNGIEPIVDAVGGVRMCLPEAMHGVKPDLDLPAGEQVLDGRTAIDFLRVRHGTGFGLELGSDLTRITRQQAFLDAMSQEVLSKNLVTDSPRLYKVVQATLRSISTSPGLGSPAALAGLAFSLRSVPADRIVFTALPVVDAPSDPNRVVWAEGTDEIWERVAADEPPPGLPPMPGDAAEADGGSRPSSTRAPSAPKETAAPSSEPDPTPSPTATTAEGVCPD
ncbi:LytR family transcriptional attenuator [Cellulomonas sp. PhB143]|nr:LytR family transcriptional attenuator [Cellulomonas sp. PhB143]